MNGARQPGGFIVVNSQYSCLKLSKALANAFSWSINNSKRMKLFLFRQISIDKLGHITYVVGINTNILVVSMLLNADFLFEDKTLRTDGNLQVYNCTTYECGSFHRVAQ